jgi:hypothetical protein
MASALKRSATAVHTHDVGDDDGNEWAGQEREQADR